MSARFRPSFKYFSWHTSLTGLSGTTIMMFFVSPMFAVLAILLCLSIVLGLNFFSPIKSSNWGSISQALIFHQVSWSKHVNLMSRGQLKGQTVSKTIWYSNPRSDSQSATPYLGQFVNKLFHISCQIASLIFCFQIIILATRSVGSWKSMMLKGFVCLFF